MPTRPLPLEILERIIDGSRDDVRTLQAVGLTCRTLIHRTRVHLFGTIRLSSQRALQLLCEALNGNPSLKTHVRQLAVVVDPGQWTRTEPLNYCTPFNEFPVKLYALALPHLCSWTVAYAGSRADTVSEYTNDMRAHFAPLTLRCIRRYANIVQHLSLGSLLFSSVTDFARLVQAFKALSALRCTDIRFRSRGEGSIHRSRRMLQTVAPLSLAVSDSSSQGESSLTGL